MKTKIFCDIADLKTIKFFNNKSIVDGFTTNPSLMRLAGAKNYKDYSIKILKVCRKNQFLLRYLQIILKICSSKLMKLIHGVKTFTPLKSVVNSKGIFTGPVIKELSDKGIKLNITCSLYLLGKLKCDYKKLNNKTNSIISIFAGEWLIKVKILCQYLKKL